MAWEQLSIDKVNLGYIIIGGFTSLFMLCSLFVKEKLYIGEATIASLCGVIFGPHAADLFNPRSWGNVDKITLECSRIVLVTSCLAIGVELPKAYMERHWRSVAILLLPVMTAGWLITSLFVWWMIEPLSWLESLSIAACVTATDPVLASSVVGKGKFAKRVPKHLRDLLSAESGCNDGMAFPFIYLSLYLIHYHLNAKEVVFHWVCFTILYECIFGAVYGFLIGYIARHLIKSAHRHSLIDRESFLVFYFVLALFCAGSGSLLGLDDLLVGFACGVGFSNDGWFTQQTEDSHVSNVIDLLLNLAYFIYLGAVIPWDQFNNPALGLVPWRLVVLAIFVILFRRIPVMLALNPLIPDIKNWREALFAGHFGPIGVGAIFAAILTRAELETKSTQPLAEVPNDPAEENYLLIQVIWPVVCFLVVSSILVHGSSVAVFTLGKRINTLTLTMSYTQGNEPSWMNRLPRIASIGKSMSKSKGDWDDASEADDPEYPAATLDTNALPGNFLRRQKEDENPSRANSRASSPRPKRKRKYDHGAGGPISQSAIMPASRRPSIQSPVPTRHQSTDASPDSEQTIKDDEKVFDEKDDGSNSSGEPDIEAYQEGDNLVVEDEEGNILHTEKTNHETKEEEKWHIDQVREKLKKESNGKHTKHKSDPHEKDEGGDIEAAIAQNLDPEKGHGYHNIRKRVSDWRHRHESEMPEADATKRGPARAYQYGNTIIIEDEDGEVVKKYDLSVPEKEHHHIASVKASVEDHEVRQSLRRLSTWVGFHGKESGEPESGMDQERPKIGKRRQIVRPEDNHDDDHRIRFTVGGNSRRLTKADFIKEIQALDPRAQARVVEASDAPEAIKSDVKKLAAKKVALQESGSGPGSHLGMLADGENDVAPEIRRASSQNSDHSAELELVDPKTNEPIPFHPISDSLSHYQLSHGGETAAQRRRRIAASGGEPGESSQTPGKSLGQLESELRTSSSRTTNEGGTAAERRRRSAALDQRAQQDSTISKLDEGETAAEKRRRLAALGQSAQDESSSDEDGRDRQPHKKGHKPVEEPIRSPGIRFVDSPVPTRGRKA